MTRPKLADLPAPPPGKTGWPWTEEAPLPYDARQDGKPWPRISIVTPSYNQGEFIEETIRSVLLQGYPDLEYIVMDGGSTDRSVEIIKKYSRWLSHWETHPDDGQADAINNALEKSSGDVFHWINSDDILLPCACLTIGERYTLNAVSVFDVINLDQSGSRSVFSNGRFDPDRMLDPTRISPFHQPGFVFPRSVYLEIGGLEKSLHYSFDWKLTYMASKLDLTWNSYELAIVQFREHPNSKTSRSHEYKNETNNLLESIVLTESGFNAQQAQALLDIIEVSQGNIIERTFKLINFYIKYPHTINSLTCQKRLVLSFLGK